MTLPTDPKGRKRPGFGVHAFVCGHQRPEGATRPSCGHQGSMDLLKELKSNVRERSIHDVRIQKSGCLDHCEFGPMCVVYPDGTWYSLSDKNAIDTVLKHLETREPQDGALTSLSES